MSAPPLPFQWDGEAMVPLRPRLADRYYVVGEVYTLEPLEDRSEASHNHYFAALHDAWLNLRDDLLDQYPTVEALRKRALIKAGYRDERSIVCESPEQAQAVAAFIEPMDRYAVVIVKDNVVWHLTAKSQSKKAMGKTEFEASKKAVLDIVSNLIGVSTDDLRRNAGRAA